MSKYQDYDLKKLRGSMKRITGVTPPKKTGRDRLLKTIERAATVKPIERASQITPPAPPAPPVPPKIIRQTEKATETPHKAMKTTDLKRTPEQMISDVIKTTQVHLSAPAAPAASRQAFIIEKALNNANYCEFDYIHDTSTIKKTSASDTSVFFAKPIARNTDEVEIAIKVSFDPIRPKRDNSLIMEQLNYRLMNQLLLRQLSPHLIAYIGSFRCPTSVLDNNSVLLKKQNALELSVAETIKGDLERTEKQYPTPFQDTFGKADERKNYSFMITEKATNAKSLKKWICHASTNEISSVLFQILFTFEMFNRIGFRHNDAHPGNILIEDRSLDSNTPETTQYNIDGQIYEFSTKRNFVKIFDFDRSSFNCDPKKVDESIEPIIKTYVQNLKERIPNQTGCRNSGIDVSNTYCQEYGQCNGMNSKYDTFLTLKSLMLRIHDCLKKANSADKKILKDTADWISNIVGKVPKDKISATSKRPDGYWIATGTKKEYIPTDEELPSTLSILKTDLFKNNRKNSPTSGVPMFVLPPPVPSAPLKKLNKRKTAK